VTSDPSFSIASIEGRNLEDIERRGSLLRRETMIDIGKGGQRPVTEYWLTEWQALTVCALSWPGRAYQDGLNA
jgi:hypothetical protein